ncbi:hypothetical protein JCM19241_941 [Vibrio ishigakensis]|uniref:Uncharacterized protein n=1 Tax=Vibrio ishigakensis TaxID=1481914 RepID=A0A0B8QHA4_9VIBR|nr:hypothetical protein JCM19241_941 [Vibrio ishigakensis]
MLLTKVRKLQDTVETLGKVKNQVVPRFPLLIWRRKIESRKV